MNSALKTPNTKRTTTALGQPSPLTESGLPTQFIGEQKTVFLNGHRLRFPNFRKVNRLPMK